MKLRHRYSISIFLVGVICVVAMVADRALSTKGLLGERASARAEALASAVAREVIKPLQSGDGRVVRERLGLFTELAGVESIRIVDAGDQPLFTAGRRFGKPDEDALKRTARELFAGPGGEARTVEVIVSSEGYKKALLPVLFRGALWGGASIALLALVSWWLGNLAGRKIETLIQAIALIDGDASLDLPDVSANSEIGALSRGFQELRRRLKEEGARRRKSEEQRDDMVNMLVHDMKQPLMIFHMAMTTLDGSETVARDKDVLLAMSMARRSTARMDAMVDGVLQTVSLERYGEPPERVRTSIEELLKECSQEGAMIARASDREWRLTVDPALNGRWVLAHPAMLRRLVGNLILNAFDHSPEGTPLTLGAKPSGTDPSSVEVFMINDAPELALEPEALLEGKRGGSAHGSHAGLGLAFCRHAAKLHAGRLEAERLEDGRVAFRAVLPMGRADGPAGAA